MNDFIADFYYNYICEQTPSLRDDPEYQKAVKAYMEVEAEVKEKTGADLLAKYQNAEGDISHLWEYAIFRQTLRFCCHFMLESFR